MSIPDLPKQNTKKSPRVRHQFLYKEILNNEIPDEQIWDVVLSKQDLDLDMNKLIDLIEKRKNIRCLDYETVLFLDCVIGEKLIKTIDLVEDGQRVSREYMDLTKLKYADVRIPLTYLMWGVKFNDLVKIYDSVSFFNNEIDVFSSWSNSNRSINLENLKKIRSVLQNLDRYNPKSIEEKVYLVSDYIQSRTQFIQTSESISTRGTFVTPTCSGDDSGLVETVNNDGYGVCVGIANLSTLLLNNPVFDTETESAFGDQHAWNKVLVDGKYYYFDTTWNITRSNNPCESGLITLSFQDKFLLFGRDTALTIGHHNQQNSSIYNNVLLSDDDYSKLVEYSSKFDYNQIPKYKSYKKM